MNVPWKENSCLKIYTGKKIDRLCFPSHVINPFGIFNLILFIHLINHPSTELFMHYSSLSIRNCWNLYFRHMLVISIFVSSNEEGLASVLAYIHSTVIQIWKIIVSTEFLSLSRFYSPRENWNNTCSILTHVVSKHKIILREIANLNI